MTDEPSVTISLDCAERSFLRARDGFIREARGCDCFLRLDSCKCRMADTHWLDDSKELRTAIDKIGEVEQAVLATRIRA